MMSLEFGILKELESSILNAPIFADLRAALCYELGPDSHTRQTHRTMIPYLKRNEPLAGHSVGFLD